MNGLPGGIIENWSVPNERVTEDDPVYEIGSPIFDKVTISLNPNYYPGNTFTIKAENNGPENLYVQKAYFDDEPIREFTL